MYWRGFSRPSQWSMRRPWTIPSASKLPQELVRGGEDPGFSMLQADKIIHVKETAVVDLFAGDAPVGQPVDLRFQEAMQRIKAARIARRAVASAPPPSSMTRRTSGNFPSALSRPRSAKEWRGGAAAPGRLQWRCAAADCVRSGKQVAQLLRRPPGLTAQKSWERSADRAAAACRSTQREIQRRRRPA